MGYRGILMKHTSKFFFNSYNHANRFFILKILVRWSYGV